MSVLFQARRLVDQIAAQLAYIDEHGRLLIIYVVPELAGREAALQKDGSTIQEGRACGAKPAGGVIERQSKVDAVTGFRSCRPGEAAHIELSAQVGDARRLGQACRAGGKDVDGDILGRKAGPHGRPVRPKGRNPFQRPVEIAVALADPSAQHPFRQGPGQTCAHRFEFRRGLGVADQMAGAGDVETMGQGLAGDLVVDQGAGDPNL